MEEEWLSCHCYDIRMSHTSFHHRSNVMRLDRITLLPYRPLAGRYFFAAAPVLVFGIFLVVPADPAIEQFLASPLCAIPAVYVLWHRKTSQGTGYCGVSFVYRLVLLCAVAENGP